MHVILNFCQRIEGLSLDRGVLIKICFMQNVFQCNPIITIEYFYVFKLLLKFSDVFFIYFLLSTKDLHMLMAALFLKIFFSLPPEYPCSCDFLVLQGLIPVAPPVPSKVPTILFQPPCSTLRNCTIISHNEKHPVNGGGRLFIHLSALHS